MYMTVFPENIGKYSSTEVCERSKCELHYSCLTLKETSFAY